MISRNIAAVLPIVLFISAGANAYVPEEIMEKYDRSISLSKDRQKELQVLAGDIYSKTIGNILSSKYWGRHGDFRAVGVEIQGSLAYGMALAGNSDLDIAYVYKYEDGRRQKDINAFTLKDEALNALQESLGPDYRYRIKFPVINVQGKGEDIDIAFFNELKSSTVRCSVQNRCSELNYGVSPSTADWLLSERLSLYSNFDRVFGTGEYRENMINRVGKFLKMWRSVRFDGDKDRVPSIALVSGLYQFVDFTKEKRVYDSSVEFMSDAVAYILRKDFSESDCKNTDAMVINLPVYQAEQNLLSKMSVASKEKLCNEMVELGGVLKTASSKAVSPEQSIEMLRPYLGDIPEDGMRHAHRPEVDESEWAF